MRLVRSLESLQIKIQPSPLTEIILVQSLVNRRPVINSEWPVTLLIIWPLLKSYKRMNLSWEEVTTNWPEGSISTFKSFPKAIR